MLYPKRGMFEFVVILLIGTKIHLVPSLIPSRWMIRQNRKENPKTKCRFPRSHVSMDHLHTMCVCGRCQTPQNTMIPDPRSLIPRKPSKSKSSKDQKVKKKKTKQPDQTDRKPRRSKGQKVRRSEGQKIKSHPPHATPSPPPARDSWDLSPSPRPLSWPAQRAASTAQSPFYTRHPFPSPGPQS
jgi:hypothetical protein